MARNISASSLAKLATKRGTEPVCLIEIEWVPGQSKILYGDRVFRNFPQIDGRILNITNISEGLNFSKNGTSQSVSILLNDTDGKIKTIYNNVDIHRKKVWVWQWFDGIPLSDKFLLFQGIIASPIIWKEGERTVSFDVITKIDDFEVGFSPEEGFFPTLPDSLIGKAWPLVFGNVSKVQTVLLDDIPHGRDNRKRGDAADSITKDPIGIQDPSLNLQIDDSQGTHDYQMQLALGFFVVYLQASFTARKLGEVADLDPIETGRGTFSGLAKKYLDEGNKALRAAGAIARRLNVLKGVRDKQKQFEKDKIGITNGSQYPQGKSVTLNIGGANHTGYFSGDEFFITSRSHPQAAKYSGYEFENPAIRTGQPVIVRDNFFFVDAGTPIRLGQGFETDGVNLAFNPVRYVVAATIAVTVKAVYAWQTDQNGLRFLNVVPTNYYTVSQLQFDSLPVTVLRLAQPLSSLIDTNGNTLGFEDELWCSVESPVGPNPVDIMEFIIEKYTTYSIDASSFASVKTKLTNFPMHFALMNRPTAIKLLQDLAYQARCILYAKDEVFFLKYLPIKEAAVDTLTEADILHQTLEVHTTPTEDLITKYVANWSPDNLYTVLGNLTVGNYKYQIILRFNTEPYGIHEHQYDYFAYNQQVLVEKAATFWMIRTSNIYKRIVCKVPISKLNLEIMDTVLLNFTYPYIANEPVLGLIEEASFNPDDYTITLGIWTPIRLGEMKEFKFAYPGNLTQLDLWPLIEDELNRRTQTSNPDVSLPEDEEPFTGDPGNGGSITYADKRKTLGDPIPSDENFVTPTVTTRIDSTSIKPLGKKPDGTSTYQYNREAVTITPIQNPATTVFPAQIVSGTGDIYTVRGYPDGLDNPSTLIENVKQLQIHEEESIPADSWCFVNRTIVINSKGETTVNHYIQLPVWM